MKNKKKGFGLSSLIKIFLILILITLIIAGTIAGGYVLAILKKAPQIDPSNYRSLINETSEVYSDDGQLIETLVSDEFSEYVTLDKIPTYLQNAVIAVEDERFYEHSGVDFKRAVGAIIHDIRTRSFDQGASTLTMQLAKNLYTSSSKNVDRKLTDVFYAFNIENHLSKEQILEAYLNSAGFSKGTVGVQAAAKTFFNKNVSELTLAESALIAGVTNRPTKYSPYNNAAITKDDNMDTVQFVLVPLTQESENSQDILDIAQTLYEYGRIDQFDLSQIKNNVYTIYKAEFNPVSKQRQELILKLMLNQGKITQDEYDNAINDEIKISIGKRSEKGISSYFVDEVKKEVIDILVSLGYTADEARAKLYNGGFNIISSMDIKLQKHLEEVTSNAKYYPGSRTDDNGIPQPQVSAVLMDQTNGQVKALIGGRGISGSQVLNRADVPRQPGSSIKPISVYMTGFENGMTAADIYLDAKIPSSVLGTSSWSPSNVGSYVGWTTIRNLIKRSSNVGAILVARDIGSDLNAHSKTTYSKAVDTDKAYGMIIDNLQKLGITSLVTPEYDPIKRIENPTSNDANASALALGGMTYGISPLEMAGAYTSLANNGIYQKPTFVNQITDSQGEVIYSKNPIGYQVIKPGTAFILTNILHEVVTQGTGTNANFSGMYLAGKTGTTNDQKDAWFVGYSPYYVCSVWIGNDKHERLPFMSYAAATLWKGIMKPIHEDLENKEPEQPDDVEKKYVRSIGRSEYFIKGTTPHNLNKLAWVEKKETKKDTDDNNNNSDSKTTKKKKTDDNNN